MCGVGLACRCLMCRPLFLRFAWLFTRANQSAVGGCKQVNVAEMCQCADRAPSVGGFLELQRYTRRTSSAVYLFRAQPSRFFL